MSSLLERWRGTVERTPVVQACGKLIDVVGLVVEATGVRAAIGEMVEALPEGRPAVQLEVVGFRSGRVLLMPLGGTEGLEPGTPLRPRGRGARVGVSDALLGRVVDAFGRPLDGGPPIALDARRSLHHTPPPPLLRRPIREPLETGVRAIDGLATIGRGQRVGVFAGAGVGKSTLIGMLCRSSQAAVNVIGLVGERGREVGEFVRDVLGPEGLSRSVVVAATGDQPPLVRARGALYATVVAEHFRDHGQDVLLVMDSLTRYCMALREVGLAVGEPPATKGYPPSVFAWLPRLLERAGTTEGSGSITGLYTLLLEGDDMADPVADSAKAILDGHVVLSRDLAERGVFPAVDPLRSLSRLMPELVPPTHMDAARGLREIASTYLEARDLVQLGAYVHGSDARVDRALDRYPRVESFLRQRTGERASIARTVEALAQLAA